MFEYIKVDVKEILRDPPEGKFYKNATIVSETNEFSDDEARTVYFKVDSIGFHQKGEMIDYRGYFKGIFPLSIISDMYLYIVYSPDEDIGPIFIDPFIYENIDEEDIDMIIEEDLKEMAENNPLESLLNREDVNVSKEMKDILEGFDMLAEPDSMLDENFLSGTIMDMFLERAITFYELNETNELITSPMIFEHANSVQDFKSNVDYTIYHEPLFYKISGNECLLVITENLEKGIIQRYKVNKDLQFIRQDDLKVSEALDVYTKEDYTIRELNDINDILFDIKNTMFHMI